MRRRVRSFLIFFSIVTAIIGSAHYYLYARLVAAPALGDSFALGGALGCAALALGTPTALVAARLLPRPRGRIVAMLVYNWLGLLLLLVSGLGFSELARLALSGAVSEPLLSRALAIAVVGAALAQALYGLACALSDVAIKRVQVSLRRLPASLSGYRIVQLTDLHIGPTLRRDWVERVVTKVNAQQADLVAITGDLVDGTVERLAEQVAPLAELTARDGVFFVTGNHEYYSGADAWLEELKRLGIRPLRNERVSIGDGEDSFELAGVDDYNAFGSGHGADLSAALRGRDEARALVLLAHQPRHIYEAASRGVDLQLSGHTHGGQIFPWGWFVRLQQPFVAGLKRYRASQIYVSRGTGFWGPPMRVGAPAEISLIELKAKT